MSSEEIRRKEEKPDLTSEQALIFLKEFYIQGDKIEKITDLESYDDRNFCIKTKEGMKYTLKFHNGVETDNSGFIEAQNEALLHLKKHEITCPYPIESINNRLIEFVSFPLKNEKKSRIFAMRLLSWVDGIPMSNIQTTKEIIYKSGAFLGHLGYIMSSFDHQHTHRHHQWDLNNLTEILNVLNAISNKTKQQMVQTVVKKFQLDVEPQIVKLRHSVLQGDFNDANIILTSNLKHINGVIDFGDMVYSCLVNEVAIAMAYALLTTYGKENPIDCLCTFFKGYISKYTLTNEEIQLLPILIQSRLAMSVTLGAYSYQKQPENEYLLLHAKPAWNALEFMLNQSDKDLIQAFHDCIKENQSDETTN